MSKRQEKQSKHKEEQIKPEGNQRKHKGKQIKREEKQSKHKEKQSKREKIKGTYLGNLKWKIISLAKGLIDFFQIFFFA